MGRVVGRVVGRVAGRVAGRVVGRVMVVGLLWQIAGAISAFTHRESGGNLRNSQNHSFLVR